jgi:hypothetical protein
MRRSGLSVVLVILGLTLLVALVAGSAPAWAGTVPLVPENLRTPATGSVPGLIVASSGRARGPGAPLTHVVMQRS